MLIYSNADRPLSAIRINIFYSVQVLMVQLSAISQNYFYFVILICNKIPISVEKQLFKYVS